MAILKKWLGLGVSELTEDAQRRKVFLTNMMSFFLAILILGLIIFLDLIILKDYLAATRRFAIFLVLLFIPILNYFQLYQIARYVLLIIPSIIIFFFPIILGDVTENQFLWFHYISALFCAVPLILFDQRYQKLQILFFFLYYLLITLFVHKGLATVIVMPAYLEELTGNFARYKVPPLFIAFFSSGVMIWYNQTNIKYEQQLFQTNAELLETQEELKTKNEQYEAINRNLEELVQKRAQIIEAKNNQIIDYANINAHKVRAPLARIMGLINISKYALTKEEQAFVLAKIDQSSKELDIILSEIALTLSEKDNPDKA